MSGKIYVYFQKIKARLYVSSLKREGASIGAAIHCKPGFLNGDLRRFSFASHGWIEAYTKINMGSTNDTPGKLTIGSWFYMNSFSMIDCHYQITIGDRVQVGPHCYICDFDHSLEVDLTAAFHRGKKTTGAVTIGDNVWIGAGVIILKSVNIGDNAVIGAGAVITKDVPPNSVVVGSPQRIIKTI